MGAFDIRVYGWCVFTLRYIYTYIYILFICLNVYLCYTQWPTSGMTSLSFSKSTRTGYAKRKASLLISVPSSSSRLRNPSVVRREESFVRCTVFLVYEVHLRPCVAVIPAYSDRLRLSLCLVRPRALTSGGGAQKGGGTDQSA